MPYRIIVGNNPINFVDPWGLQSANEWSRAFTGLNYYDAIGNAVDYVKRENYYNKIKASEANRKYTYYSRKSDFLMNIARVIESIAPKDGLLLDSLTLLSSLAVDIERQTSDIWANYYWSKDEYYGQNN